MTALEALVAYQNGAYKDYSNDRLVQAIDALNAKIDQLNDMFRMREIEPTPELREDRRKYQLAKDQMVRQSMKIEPLKTF